MDDKDFFFLDRPAVPATQQNLIDPAALLEASTAIRGHELHPDEVFFASEVKSSEGVIVGTVLYAAGATYVDLLASNALEDDEVDEDSELSDTEGDTQ